MAETYLHISIASQQVAPFFRDLVNAEKKTPQIAAQKLIALLTGIEAGDIQARVMTMIDSDSGTAAAWTIACTRANAATNLVSIGAIIATASVTTTNGSPVLTAVGANSRQIGDIITGTGIALGTTIVAINKEAKTIQMSANATASATVTATIYERAYTFLEGTDFVRGADDTATGANLAAAINAAMLIAGNPMQGLFATVADVTGTITLTALMKSLGGRQITFATDDATAFAITNTVAGATGVVSRGAIAYTFGITP